MKSKKIFFTPIKKIVKDVSEMPKPAVNHVPRWYKDQRLFSNQTNSVVEAHKLNDVFATYKMCVPLIDTITSGYIISLNCDVLVFNGSETSYAPQLRWSSSLEPLDNPDGNIVGRSSGNYPIPTGYNPILFRWHSDWKIKTPKGYSLWVTHPSHRHELPFFTINGFVDTDKHPNALVFPFFIKDGFEGVIEKGTPIAQILPIKRDVWQSKIGIANHEELEVGLEKLKQQISRGYKKNWWTKKVYK